MSVACPTVSAAYAPRDPINANIPKKATPAASSITWSVFDSSFTLTATSFQPRGGMSVGDSAARPRSFSLPGATGAESLDTAVGSGWSIDLVTRRLGADGVGRFPSRLLGSTHGFFGGVGDGLLAFGRSVLDVFHRFERRLL